jgi:hypothetical protein
MNPVQHTLTKIVCAAGNLHFASSLLSKEVPSGLEALLRDCCSASTGVTS